MAVLGQKIQLFPVMARTWLEVRSVRFSGHCLQVTALALSARELDNCCFLELPLAPNNEQDWELLVDLIFVAPGHFVIYFV